MPLIISVSYLNSNLKARKFTKNEDFTFMTIIKEKLMMVLSPEIYKVCFEAAEVSMNDNKNHGGSGNTFLEEMEREKQLEGIDVNLLV